jgi:hypothetical protein
MTSIPRPAELPAPERSLAVIDNILSSLRPITSMPLRWTSDAGKRWIVREIQGSFGAQCNGEGGFCGAGRENYVTCMISIGRQHKKSLD